MRMRRSTLFLFTTIVALLSLGGVALAATIQCSGGECLGTEEDDDMQGTSVRDVMNGLGGSDTMHANGGDDYASGGDGDDVAYGGGGNDLVGGGTELQDGGVVANKLYGGSGDDVVQGGWAGVHDVMYGGDGNDRMVGEFGVDIIYGGDGEDRLESADDCYVSVAQPDDTLYGGPGNDELLPRDGNGIAYGNEGDDLVLGNCLGQVDVYSGKGSDTIYSAEEEGGNPGIPDYIDCGPGRDTVYFQADFDTIRSCEVKQPFSPTPP
jgi:Ca2+-binding RTX toxin-like protein